MSLRIVGTGLMVGSFLIFAQNAPLSFEAASLKPAATPNTPGRIMRRMNGGPGTSDPGRFTYQNVTLKLMVMMAYNLKQFQVEGPDWIDTQEYDLVATMPQGTSKEQAAQMMQTLLKERFKLDFHRETRPMPLFDLAAGKGGPKMKEVEAPAMPAAAAPPPAPGRMGGGAGVRIMMSPSGIRLAGQMTMSQLADALTRQMARPVLDKTELTKTYDVDITWMPDTMDISRMGPPPGADAGGEPGRKGGPGSGPEATMTLAQALQSLGLRLDARKEPAEILIVDRAEKAPVEN